MTARGRECTRPLVDRRIASASPAVHIRYNGCIIGSYWVKSVAPAVGIGQQPANNYNIISSFSLLYEKKKKKLYSNEYWLYNAYGPVDVLPSAGHIYFVTNSCTYVLLLSIFVHLEACTRQTRVCVPYISRFVKVGKDGSCTATISAAKTTGSLSAHPRHVR